MKNLLRLSTGLGFALLACTALRADEAATFPLTGKVTDADGRSIAGATVECYQTGQRSILASDEPRLLERATTDSAGAFEFKVPHSMLMLIARHEGLAPIWKRFSARPGKEETLALPTPTVLAGAVVDEADQPVPDAQVFATVVIAEIPLDGSRRTYSYLAGQLAKKYFSTRTSADGRFRIEGFPTNATADLAIQAPGKVLSQPPREHLGPDTLRCRAGQENLRLVAEPAGSIEGKIVADVAGEVLPVAHLTLQPDAPGMFGLSARDPSPSNPDGTFRIQDVAAGSYRIRGVFGTNAVAEWVAETVPVSVESGETTRGVDLTATRGGLLQVTVLGKEDRKPLAGIAVSAYGQAQQVSETSDADGLAVFRLPPGTYQVGAYRESWRSDNTGAEVEAGETNRVEIELASPPKIQGVVRRPDGQPAAGLNVRIVGSYSTGEESETKTDQDGRFEMEWNPQRFGQSDRTFSLLVRDPERNLAIAEDIDEDTEPLELSLEPGLILVGHAECEGKPLSNATAALVYWTGNMGMHLQGMAVETDTPGQFEIPALPPDGRYGLYVSAPGYGQQYVDAREYEGESGRVELDPVELKPANMKLAGQVVDEDDKPVAGAYVNLSGDGQPNSNTRTDNEGRFRFDQVCEGVVRLFANARGSHGNMTAEAGDTNVVVRLGESYSMSANSAPRKLSGVITDPDDKPVAGAMVAVFPSGSSRWVKTDDQGAFKLTWTVQSWQMQSGGDPCLVVRDLDRDLAAAEDILEDVTNLNVQLTPALTLTGRVENVDGQPLAKAQVGLWLLACNTYSQISDQLTTTGTNGDFEIKTLPSGPQYTIYATAKDYGRSQRKLEQEPETNRVELEPFVLKLANQVIEGQVVNEDDKPVSGVNVSLSGDDQPQASDITDRKGRFSFKVCEGMVRLFASSQSGYADATAEAGDTNVVIQLTRNRSFGERTVRRVSLKGKPLPDLSPLGLAADAVPAGKPALLCLLDVEQRPSRRVARLLGERQDSLRQKGITLVLIQAAVIPPDSLESWKTDSAMSCPVGQVEKATKARWATDVEALPWLILTDVNGDVAAEGFPLDELDAKLDALSK